MIRIRQCQDDCCAVREPSKRFWMVHLSINSSMTSTSFAQAVAIADAHTRLGAPS